MKNPAKPTADEVYLASYDPAAYPRHPLAVDVVALTVQAARLAVLLVRRAEAPMQGVPALPGAFVGPDETLEDAARRALATKAAVERLFLEQLYTFGDPGRDRRARVVSVAYYALAPAGALTPATGSEAAFLSSLDEDGLAQGSAGEALALAFDHGRILRTAVERLRGKLWYSPVALELAGESFSLHELQGIYEAILGRRLAKPAFRRRILASGLVEPAGGRRTGSHRPAATYRARVDAGASR